MRSVYLFLSMKDGITVKLLSLLCICFITGLCLIWEEIMEGLVSRVQYTLNILVFCERFNTCSWDPPGRLHSPETSSVFSFLSKSATLFPRILQAKSGGSGDVGTANIICVCSCFTVQCLPCRWRGTLGTGKQTLWPGCTNKDSFLEPIESRVNFKLCWKHKIIKWLQSWGGLTFIMLPS